MIVKSVWGADIDCEVIDNSSDKLVVVIPGIGYNLSKAYMRYSIKLAIELGFDVLPMQFGFQIAGKEYDKKYMNFMIDESRKLLYGNLKKKYKEIIFIGKSIGTVVQNMISDDLQCKVRHIYLTPLDKTVELGIKDNSLVAAGTSDPYLSRKGLNIIKENKSLKFIEVAYANHSLDIKNDVIKSIDILHKVMEEEKHFLLNIK